MKRLILLILALLPVIAEAQMPTLAKPVTISELARINRFFLSEGDSYILLQFTDAMNEGGQDIGVVNIKVILNKEKTLSYNYAYYMSGSNVLTIVDVDDVTNKADYDVVIYELRGSKYLALISYKTTDEVLSLINARVFTELPKK